MANEIKKILNGLATAYRKYPLKQIEETKEVGYTTTEIKSLLKSKLPKKKEIWKDATDYASGEKRGTAFIEDNAAIGFNSALTEIGRIVENL